MTVSVIWQSPLSPGEVKDYTLDATLELDAVVDTISTETWTLDSAAIAAGLLIHASTHDSKSLTIWLEVDAPSQGSALFDDPGTNFTALGKFETVGGRTYERTCQFKVVRL